MNDNFGDGLMTRELEDAGKVVDSARDVLAQLKGALSSLTHRHEQLSRTLDRHKAARRKLGRGSPKSRAESSTEYALRATKTMIARNRKLLKKHERTVREKEAILKRVRAQSEKINKDVARIRQVSFGDSNSDQLVGGPIHGEHLAAARGLTGMSKQHFATMLGISAAKLRAYEAHSGELDLDPIVAAEIQQSLIESGIELIQPGVYVGNGGCGIRLTKQPNLTAGSGGKGPRLATHRKVKRKKQAA